MYLVLALVQARLWDRIQETHTVGLLTSESLTVLQEKVKRILIESRAPLAEIHGCTCHSVDSMEVFRIKDNWIVLWRAATCDSSFCDRLFLAVHGVL